jgi:predicted nucleic acid-binding protein
MPTRPRFVFDTNAVVSAVLLKRSVARQAFDQAFAEGDLLVSIETIDELNQVLGRADFSRYVTEDERMEFLAVCCVVNPVQATVHWPFAIREMTSF